MTESNSQHKVLCSFPRIKNKTQRPSMVWTQLSFKPPHLKLLPHSQGPRVDAWDAPCASWPSPEVLSHTKWDFPPWQRAFPDLATLISLFSSTFAHWFSFSSYNTYPWESSSKRNCEAVGWVAHPWTNTRTGKLYPSNTGHWTDQEAQELRRLRSCLD